MEYLVSKNPLTGLYHYSTLLFTDHTRISSFSCTAKPLLVICQSLVSLILILQEFIPHYVVMHQSSEKVTYNFGVKLMGASRQHLVNGRRVFVDDKSKASVLNKQ